MRANMQPLKRVLYTAAALATLALAAGAQYKPRIGPPGRRLERRGSDASQDRIRPRRAGDARHGRGCGVQALSTEQLDRRPRDRGLPAAPRASVYLQNATDHRWAGLDVVADVRFTPTADVVVRRRRADSTHSVRGGPDAIDVHRQEALAVSARDPGGAQPDGGRSIQAELGRPRTALLNGAERPRRSAAELQLPVSIPIEGL